MCHTVTANSGVSLLLAVLLQVVVKDFQHAAKAQRASVTPADILRYEEYNERHGAKYCKGGEDGTLEGDDDDDDW